MTVERKRLLHAYGAELIFTDPMDGSDGAIREARKQVAANPDRVFLSRPVQQRRELARALRDDGARRFSRRPTAASRTSWRASARAARSWARAGGCAKRTRPIKLISFQPDSPLHGLEGLKHMETAIVPGIYDPSLADEDMRVSTEDAYTMVRRLAREEGLLVGISGGAALAGALKVARNARNAVIVTIFPDSADKYMSERFWNAPA